MGKCYNHVKEYDRIQIEALWNAGMSITEIALQLGFSYPTIWREINVRGTYTHRNTDWTESKKYSSDLSQEKCNKNKKMHGKELKIGNDLEFISYFEKMVLEKKYSPEAILTDIKEKKLHFKTEVCLSTLYNYIRNGIFLNLTMENLPMPRFRKKKSRVIRKQKKASVGTSIEQRSKAINNREEFGHWEMDSVVGPRGKSKKCFLVLTERKSLKEIIELLNNHSSTEVVRALDRLEREMGEKKFRDVFKSITVDNGTEFSDFIGLQRSRRNKKSRTKVYYCHAYSSWERGSNENQNKMIRRFYPKGVNFDHITRKQTKELESWMNHYPRPNFGGKTAQVMYEQFQRQEHLQETIFA